MILNLVIRDNKMRNHITGLSFKIMKQVIRMFDRIEMLSDKKALVLVFIDPQKVYGYLII